MPFAVNSLFLSGKTYLGQPVEWEPRQEHVGEEFTHGEQGKDNPVGQPACVIFLLKGLQSLLEGCIP